MVTKGDGDGDTVGVSTAVVGKGVRDIVKLPEGDPEEVKNAVVTKGDGDGDIVGVSTAVVGKGVRDIVKLPEGDPVEV